jgi:hypothetical protein
MPYVQIPKDLAKVKTKVAFNLTKRQLVCFSAALATSLPAYFLLKDTLGTAPAGLVMLVIALPSFLAAMYEKNGQPFEKVVKQVVTSIFIRLKQRPYRTENIYEYLEKGGKPIKNENEK